MDEGVMIAWVDEILKPYVANAHEHIIHLLILDSYRCHMMGLVVQRIQELGIEVRHIPGGCTKLCQPVDVGFNKPFKDRMRKQWLSWMIDEGIIHGTTTPPSSRCDVAGWVDCAMEEMKREERIIKNAWRKTGYEWFLKEGGEIAIAAAVTKDGDENEADVMKEGGEIPVVEKMMEEDEAIAGVLNEEDKAIVGVLNEYLGKELFSDTEGGDEEEEELPHYIV